MSGPGYCDKHGPHAGICCACVREPVEAQRDRLREALRPFAERARQVVLEGGGCEVEDFDAAVTYYGTGDITAWREADG